MPKVPTTSSIRRSLSPVLKLSDKQLHKLFDHLLGTAKTTSEQVEIIDDSGDESQLFSTSSTRRKKNMITRLLDLGNKTGSDNSAETTQAKKNFIVDLLKHGKSGSSKKTSDKSSGSSSSLTSDAYSSWSSSDSEDAESNVSHKNNVEDPLAASVRTLPTDAPDGPSVELPPSDAAAQSTTPKETEAKVEKEVTTLDGDESSGKGQQPINKDALESTIDPSPAPAPAQGPATSSASVPVSAPAPASSTVSPPASALPSASTPASAPVSVPVPVPVSSSASPPVSVPVCAPVLTPVPVSTAASAPVSVPVPVPVPAPAPDASEPTPTPSTTPAFPFNHFPRRTEGARRGLRRENAFYHKSHYEIAWVPEFGPRDAPPQTLEDVLPPWDSSFRSASAGMSAAMPVVAVAHPPQLGTSAAAYPSPVESPPSAPAAVLFVDGSTSLSAGTGSSRGRRGTVMKRGREPEDENIKPGVDDDERPMTRRRRVGLNKAVGV